jgi:hypothetical protein
MPDPIDLEFDIEWYPDGGEPGWWCNADPDGVASIAHGTSPWNAIANALRGLPEARTRHERLGAFCDDLLAGRVACTRCGNPIEPPCAEHPMCSLMHCLLCAEGRR